MPGSSNTNGSPVIESSLNYGLPATPIKFYADEKPILNALKGLQEDVL